MEVSTKSFVFVLIIVSLSLAVSNSGSTTVNVTGVAVGRGHGEWTWVNGANVAGQKGTYGTQGTAAASNIPGARAGAVSWADAAGNFWLFGGENTDPVAGTPGNLNDLWKYEP